MFTALEPTLDAIMEAGHEQSEKLLGETKETDQWRCGAKTVALPPRRNRSLRAVLGAALFVAGLVQVSYSNWDDWSSIIAEPSGKIVECFEYVTADANV